MTVLWTTPPDLAHALAAVADGGTPVGGGAALMSAAFAFRIEDVAVDLSGVLETGMDADGVVGAGTTLAGLIVTARLRRAFPAVAAAAAATATPQVRAVATIGGTIAARLPGADLPAALAAHGAKVRLVWAEEGTDEELDVVAYLARPDLPPHLVTGIRLTVAGAGTHRRFALREGPAPAIAVVAGVRTEEGLDLWAGAVGPTAAPIRFGHGLDAGQLRDDARASASYRARLVSSLAADVRTELGA